jgi:hypothetical protein
VIVNRGVSERLDQAVIVGEAACQLADLVAYGNWLSGNGFAILSRIFARSSLSRNYACRLRSATGRSPRLATFSPGECAMRVGESAWHSGGQGGGVPWF